MVQIKPDFKIFLRDVEIYRANPSPIKIMYGDDVLYELTEKQTDLMEGETDGNSVWKIALGKLGYQRPD